MAPHQHHDGTPETRLNIITTACRRCDWQFRYVRKRYGRRRYYCEVCVVLEAMDSNDARPRKTAQVRPTLRTFVKTTDRRSGAGASSAALREMAEGAPVGAG